MSDLEKAVSILKEGGLVAIPTETVYGLAASIQNISAIRKIFEIKERPFFDPLIVHVANIEDAKKLVVEFPNEAEKLAQKFWPGPLTLVLAKNSQVDDLITAGFPTVAIRIPRHPLALELLKQTGPLAAPSANKFGKTSPSTAEHVRSEFGDKIFILDGGACEAGIESTVLRIGNSLEILRPGLITAEQMESCLNLSTKIARKSGGDAPGQTDTHYQPKTFFALLKSRSDLKSPEFLQALQKKNLSPDRGEELLLNDSPELVARRLYSDLRQLGKTPGAFIYAIFDRPKSSAWEAIWDRLSRAAHFRT